ncbi:MAG: response regulator [Candidatus Staskawiczbacteria bacterium]|nr:response regulator [Candidatus Staskawiczbacteria bacterium]
MKKILLVEDDEFIADIYANYLKREGYKVDIARDGQVALEKARDNYPDLIILDILLPKMDGWEVLKALRDDPKTENFKVIITSNNNPQSYAEDVTHFKVMEYFLKSETTIEEIVHAVKEAIG